MCSDTNQEQSPPSRDTRRTKLKADRVSKPTSNRNAKKVKPSSLAEEFSPSRQSSQPKKTPVDRKRVTNPAKPQLLRNLPFKGPRQAPSRNKSKQSSGSTLTQKLPSTLTASQTMTEKERSALNTLLQKAKSSGEDTIYQFQAQQTGPRCSNSGEELSDTDNRLSPRPSSTNRATMNTRTQAPKRAARPDQLKDDEESDHDYPDSQHPDDYDDDERSDPEEEHGILHIMSDDDEADGIGHRLGESDAEQDVSYNLDKTDHANVQDPIEHDMACTADASNFQQLPNQNTVQPTSVENNTNIIDSATRAEPNGHSLDESVVLNIVQSLKRDILSQFDKSFDQVLKEIRTDREQIKKLLENLSEMTSIVTTTACAIFINQMSSNTRVKEIQTKLCLLNGLLNDNFLLKVLPRVVVCFLVTNTIDGSGSLNLENKGIEYLSVLFFSKKVDESKIEKFNSEVGKIYSKFRYSLSMSSFLAMQKNSFQTFTTNPLGQNAYLDPSHITEDETSVTTPNAMAMLQPFWLHPGYVMDVHCINAAKKLENRGGAEGSEDGNPNGELSQANADSEYIVTQDSSQSTGKQKLSRSGPLTRDEIANAAAVMVYRRITSVLHRARAATKVQLFHDLTYLFTSWSHHGASSEQETIIIRWETERVPNAHYLEDLSHMKVISAQQRLQSLGHTTCDVDLQNMEQL